MTRFEPWISDMEMTALPTELQPLPTILHYLSELGLPRVESKINYFNVLSKMEADPSANITPSNVF